MKSYYARLIQLRYRSEHVLEESTNRLTCTASTERVMICWILELNTIRIAVLNCGVEAAGFSQDIDPDFLCSAPSQQATLTVGAEMIWQSSNRAEENIQSQLFRAALSTR